jgi:CRP-like cAMP-binding protein
MCPPLPSLGFSQLQEVASVRLVNRLIEGLPPRARNRILERCKPVDLVFGAVLCQSGKPFRHVYFPLTGFISTLGNVAGHPPLEMRLIGNEGMLGVTLVLGVGTAPLRAVVQGSGTALRMTAIQLRRELRESPALLRMLNRYLYVVMAQLSQTAACNRFHEVEARLARSLLMMHDRAHSDCFHLTHAFLADMLGVRRSGVTIAAGALQKRRLIRYARGEIRILDRQRLEAASCECYAALIADYAQVFG